MNLFGIIESMIDCFKWEDPEVFKKEIDWIEIDKERSTIEIEFKDKGVPILKIGVPRC